MCSRAVHIEQLDDMTTDAFINALRCFTAIRGPIQQLRSDQGSNFVGARNELAKAMKELDNKIQSYLTSNRCKFVMNVPYSSHRGGVRERQIRTTRSILNSVLNNYKGRLGTSSLRTFLYEVMAYNQQPTIDLSMPERSKEFGASDAKLFAHHEEQDTSSTSRKFCQGRNLRPETMAQGPVSGRTILE